MKSMVYTLLKSYEYNNLVFFLFSISKFPHNYLQK